ncbi:flagellar hook-associated protein FlgK [Demequina aestuarii]|uniref:flagellar hook-associated protein FlgK n=1 Tax=Demequina aestuarii TaxID=327095 RepID=UPI000784F9D0|nr:flagellar hook-associated protein FlgK [Demequina aestuarii]
MSSFSGLSTALSSLIAQRQALEVSGQNIANANTVGYTRQRADLQSASTSNVTALFETSRGTGNGVGVVDIARLGDQFLDARLRTQTSQAAHTRSLATTFGRLETAVIEPSDTGLASGLNEFWDAWQDVANSPDNAATRTALLGSARTLVTQIGDTYRALESQWSQARAETDALVTEVNTAAESVAHLNQQIRGVLASGGSPNELMDHRDQLITTLSNLVGATATPQQDGTVTVLVDGNPLVQGDRTSAISVQGSYVMTAAVSEPAPSPDAVSLRWADGTALALDGGELAGTLTAVQPASLGGPIANAVAAVDDLATQVATSVNAVHTTGTTLAAPPADTGVDFFSFTAGAPAALGLTVAVTDPQMVAAGNGVGGTWDGSIADAISQIGVAVDSPDAQWRAFVVDLGVTSAAATRRATVAESARSTSETLHLSNASVDLDEEMTNMLAYQRAYEGAARVMTAIDEMLDTLINRTGVVGR